MSILGAIMVPHPPLIIPEVGKGEEQQISTTIDSYKRAAEFVLSKQPDTVIVTTPHSVIYGDYFHISPGRHAKGDFGNFGAPQVKVEADYDLDFTIALESLADAKEFPLGTFGERNPALDHATMIPLYFMEQADPEAYKKIKVIRLGLSGLPLVEHYRLGMMIAQVSEELGRKVVMIGSGDLSHKMKKEGPYGFAKEGPEYDDRIMDVMGRAAFGELLSFDDLFCEKAAECGHRSFVIMAGALDGLAVTPGEATHEATFGVGYGVCTYDVTGEDENRCFLALWEAEQKERLRKAREFEDPYVKLARFSLESYVIDRKKIKRPEELPRDMTERKAGTFVSLHKHGELRGCIGTIGPVQENIAEEIIENAISAATRDPRFRPVQASELPELEISVDVLGEMEPISGKEELDVIRYGVVVENGMRRGLLLPNLEGVDTVEEQIAIAKRKAAIPENEPVKMYRFEVVRHV